MADYEAPTGALIHHETALQALNTIIQLHFEKTLEKKRAVDLQKKELWKMFQLFFLFLSLLFLGQAQSPRLQCRHCWVPIGCIKGLGYLLTKTYRTSSQISRDGASMFASCPAVFETEEGCDHDWAWLKPDILHDMGAISIIRRNTGIQGSPSLEDKDNFSDDTDEDLEGVVEISSSDSEASTAHIEARHAAFRARHKDKATTAEKGKGKAADMTPSDRTLVARLPSVFQARLNNAIKGLAKDSELLKFVKAAHSKEVKNLKADTTKLSTKLAEALEGFMRVTETQKSAWEDALREF
nr:uncharacterized protein LOC107849581 [Ipomoea batatas]